MHVVSNIDFNRITKLRAVVFIIGEPHNSNPYCSEVNCILNLQERQIV